MASPTQLTDPAAQPVSQPAAEPQPQASPAAGAPSQSEWFLEIDERNRWKTKEDAVKGFRETQETAIKLGPWDKEFISALTAPIEQGGFGWSPEAVTPQAIITLLDELASIRYKEQQAKGNGGQPAASPQPAQPSQPAYVTPEQLQQTLAQQQEELQYKSRVETSINSGKNILRELVSGTGLQMDEKNFSRLQKEIETSIVEQSQHDKNGSPLPGSVEHKFIFGTDADRKAIVEAEFSFWKETMEAYANAKNASYAKEKAAGVAAQPKPAQPGTGSLGSPSGKRLSESELRQGLLARLEGKTS